MVNMSDKVMVIEMKDAFIVIDEIVSIIERDNFNIEIVVGIVVVVVVVVVGIVVGIRIGSSSFFLIFAFRFSSRISKRNNFRNEVIADLINSVLSSDSLISFSIFFRRLGSYFSSLGISLFFVNNHFFNRFIDIFRLIKEFLYKRSLIINSIE